MDSAMMNTASTFQWIVSRWTIFPRAFGGTDFRGNEENLVTPSLFPTCTICAPSLIGVNSVDKFGVFSSYEITQLPSMILL